MIATAPGTSGANFLVFVALLQGGGDVLVEQPGYDPLMGAAAVLGARVTRFERRFEDGYRLDPDAVRRAITPRTRLVVITNLHNPSGVLASDEDLDEVGRIADGVGAKVLVDEVYLDSVQAWRKPPGLRSGAGARTKLELRPTPRTPRLYLPPASGRLAPARRSSSPRAASPRAMACRDCGAGG